MNSKLSFGFFVHPRRLKVLVFLLLVGLIASASASIYVFFYSGMTATIRAPDISLAAGPDASGSCTVYPCATVTISATSDTATVSLSMFKANSGFSPSPATYYSNLVQVKNGNPSVSHSIMSVQIYNIAATSLNDYGSITVYYCTTQTEFSPAGSPITPADCVGSFAITSSTGGSVSGSFPVSIPASGTQYIEVVAYAGSSGSISDTITFNIALQWV